MLPLDETDNRGIVAAREGRGFIGPIRPSVDVESCMDEPGPGCSHSDASVAAAARLTLQYDETTTPTVVAYQQLLGYAPTHHLESFGRRGGIIVLAPSIAGWLAGSDAAARRGRELDERERAHDAREYGRESGVCAIFDPYTDALVFPTAVRARDLLHPVLHELGHALTLDHVWVEFQRFEPLLAHLPRRIADHLDRYSFPEGYDGRRLKVAEVFAEAYAMLVGGWQEEVPHALTSAVLETVLSVTDAEPHRTRGTIDPETGRTATYCRPADLLRESTGVRTDPDQVPPLARGDRRLVERQARPWPPRDVR